METQIGRKRMTLTRRFQKQQNQTRLSAAFFSIPDTNESTVQKNEERDKLRQLPRIYYVKVAVLIDQGLWNFYYSTVHAHSAQTRKMNAIQLIHQFYSHIMNGVNMIYKGIQDNSIRIYVVLNKFIILKSDLDFRHLLSKLTYRNGTMYVDGLPYLNDLINWDLYSPLTADLWFSHGMVFTRIVL
ncbi:hypothetical protein ACJMK2_022256 [Sinanodonta woodiana]|uniref:Uncharacterized protein n=1 Tax=Sinanodonta woodiana TaxID=1069815 RepID=A0ABD3TK68_SINWO